MLHPAVWDQSPGEVVLKSRCWEGVQMEKNFWTVWDPDRVIQCDWTYLCIHRVEPCIML